MSEKRRYRQSLRQQRRERLEHYSPETQADRSDRLYNVLEQTTMVVTESDLSLVEGGGQQQKPQPSLGFKHGIEAQESLQDIGFSYSDAQEGEKTDYAVKQT